MMSRLRMLGVPVAMCLVISSIQKQRQSARCSRATKPESYDYVIVGAGSAGCALAARLSEDPKNRVLLLEEGLDFRSSEAPDAMRSPNPIGMVMPAYYPQFQFPTLLARRSPTQTPKLYWRGRGVGGSSLINGQIAIRAIEEDFDEWVAQGCVGWAWKDVLPCFRRLERDPIGGPLHSNSGPIPIYRAPMWKWGRVDMALMQAALDLGYPWMPNGDCNAPGNGLATLPINSENEQRVTANDGYIEPIRHRPNLTIIGGAMVDRVLLDPSSSATLKANGVRAKIAGVWEEILTTKEVIICAGAIHSPAILMRSGIGPKEMLAKFNIPCLADLPVGRNLQEHPLLGAILRLKPEAQTKSPFERHTNLCLRFSTGEPGDAFMVSLNGFGGSIGQFLPQHRPFTSMQSAYTEEEIHAQEEFFLGGDREDGGVDSSAVVAGEWCFMSGRLVEGCPCCEGLHFHGDEDQYTGGPILPNDPRVLIGKPDLEPLGMLCVWLGKVFSRGFVELASKDAEVHPKVEMNLLADQRDRVRMKTALSKLVQVCKHPAISSIIDSVTFDAADTGVTGLEHMLHDANACSSLSSASSGDTKLSEWMSRNVGDTQHVAGTCAMGKSGERVVDPSLRVNGISNLRVADASIMPSLVRANTHLTAVMIGERAAEIIRDDK